jgi:hypothetical protein
MKRTALWTIGILALSAIFPGAFASTLPGAGNMSADSTPTVLYSQSSLVRVSAANSITLNAPGVGEVFLTLTDLGFPDPFSSLKFSLSDSPTAEVGLANPGVLTLYVSGAATLYADVFAQTATGADCGLYNLTGTFLGGASPVPLPASGLLLGTSLLLLGLRGRAHLTV